MKPIYWIPLAAVLSGTALALKLAPVISSTFTPFIRMEPIEVAQTDPATASRVPTGGLFVAEEDGSERIFPSNTRTCDRKLPATWRASK